MIPRDTVSTTDSALVAYKNRALWVKTDTGWLQVGADIDTTSLSARIDQKLNTSDTLDMLSSYLRKMDTTGKWKPLAWYPGVSEVIGLQDSLADRFTKDQSDARYLQGNQTITLSGDVLGSGATGISTTLKNTGTAGTYTKVTTDAQGRVTSGTTLAVGDIPSGLPYIPISQKGAANGVATLGGDGKVTPSQLPVTGGGFLGQWNASTNTPTLADGVGSPGEYYRVSTAGTVDLGSGSQTFAQGDAVVYTAAGEWIKDPNYQAVSSVNGKVGAVVIDKGDVGLPLADNTPDLAKPISTATQTALNGKEPTIAPGTTAQVWIGNKTWATTSTLVRPLFSAGTGLTYNSSTGAFAANFGTNAGTVMQGNDSRVTGAVPNTRTITAGSGLTGGGDLTANRSFAIDPAYASFTNYYTKTNLQTNGQAAVHWGNITNAPIFWQAANHPAGSAFTMTYTGAEVPATATYNAAGHTTAQTKRNLTAGDISAAPASGSGNYIQNISSGIQTANFRIAGHGIFYRDGSNSLNNHVTLLNAAATRGANIQLNGDVNPGFATWIHNGSTWVKRQEYFADGNSFFYGPLTSSSTINSTNSTVNTMLSYSGGGWGISGTSTNHPFALYTNNAERVRITATGDVGIGTTSPGAKLHVNGTSIISSTGTNNVSTFNQGDGIVIAAQKVGALTTRTELDLEGETTSLHSYNPSVKVTSGVIFDARSAKGVDQYVQSTASSRLNELIMDTLRTENNIRMANSDVFRTRLDSGAFRIQRNTTNNFTALATGNVGIGTATPEESADVRGYVAASQGPGNLNNRTVVGYATGGGYITGETHNGTSWNRASMHIDAINTLMENATVTGALSNAGARYYHTRTISATTTALSSDHVLVCNSASGNITLNLPSTVGVDGLVYIIKKSSSSNTVTIDPSGSEMITTYSGDLSTMPLPAGSTEAVTLMASGGKWVQL